MEMSEADVLTLNDWVCLLYFIKYKKKVNNSNTPVKSSISARKPSAL